MNYGNGVVAIIEAEIDKKILDITDCSNRIKVIFNKLDDIVEKLKTSYVSTSATTLYKKYEEFNDNYSVIINNILSYSTDLMSLKRRYNSSFDDLAQKIKSDALRLEKLGTDKYEEKR